MADDDVPPLEDMTEVMGRVIKDFNKTSVQVKKDTTSDTSTQKSSNVTEDTKHVQNQETGDKSFGGMKKGFLFNNEPRKSKSGSSCSSALKLEKSEEMPFISKKNNESKDSQFRFDEVQAALKLNEGLLQNQDELLRNIEKNETLYKKILDPTFMRAVAEFQKSPEAAMEKYKNNVEIQQFFKEFCSVIGDHFVSLGNQEPSSASTVTRNEVLLNSDTSPEISAVCTRKFNKQPTSEEDNKVKEILNNPEIKAILLDPHICQLMDALRNSPEAAQRLLQSTDPKLHDDVRKLVEVGLLKINH